MLVVYSSFPIQEIRSKAERTAALLRNGLPRNKQRLGRAGLGLLEMAV